MIQKCAEQYFLIAITVEAPLVDCTKSGFPPWCLFVSKQADCTRLFIY